jgi:hypothetical protein
VVCLATAMLMLDVAVVNTAIAALPIAATVITWARSRTASGGASCSPAA